MSLYVILFFQWLQSVPLECYSIAEILLMAFNYVLVFFDYRYTTMVIILSFLTCVNISVEYIPQKEIAGSKF